MTLISLAICVAFIYSAAALFLPGQMDFFWELVTLIDIMLLGHWIEMRSVRQASGALNELAKLMPDTAERIGASGQIETGAGYRACSRATWCWCGRGRAIPADGEVVEGRIRRQRGHDHWRIPAGQERAGRASDRRHDQWRRQPARAGHRHRRTNRPGRDHAPGGAGPAVESRTQMLADRAAGWLFYVALAVAAPHRHRLDDRHRLQRRR